MSGGAFVSGTHTAESVQLRVFSSTPHVFDRFPRGKPEKRLLSALLVQQRKTKTIFHNRKNSVLGRGRGSSVLSSILVRDGGGMHRRPAAHMHSHSRCGWLPVSIDRKGLPKARSAVAPARVPGYVPSFFCLLNTCCIAEECENTRCTFELIHFSPTEIVNRVATQHLRTKCNRGGAYTTSEPNVCCTAPFAKRLGHEIFIEGLFGASAHGRGRKILKRTTRATTEVYGTFRLKRFRNNDVSITKTSQEKKNFIYFLHFFFGENLS